MSPDQPNQTPTGADAESQDAPPGAAVRKTGLKRTRKGQTDPSGQTGQSGQSGQSADKLAKPTVSGRPRRPPIKRVKAVTPVSVEASPVGATPAGAMPTLAQPAAIDQPADRRRRIAVAAYLRAERRGFQGNHQEADWLEAEREIDAAASVRAGRRGRNDAEIAGFPNDVD